MVNINMIKSPAQFITSQIWAKISQHFESRYPQFTSSLGKYRQATFKIKFKDLPFDLIINCKNKLDIQVYRGEKVTTEIIGDRVSFLELLLRKVDGDSLFFQQKLKIVGDVEAATAFRNCLERLHFDILEFITPISLPFKNVIITKINELRQPARKINVPSALELVCPAGNLEIMKTAIDAGANTVYFGFARHGNARNFIGLNFSEDEAKQGVEYVHAHGGKILSAINAFPQVQNIDYVKDTIDIAAQIGVDAIILADLGMLEYATNKHPLLNRHLSVQASASSLDTLEFYAREFGIKRAVLPRVLDLARIKDICIGARELGVEIEIFGFGGLCVMAEGRCSLSGYVTGKAPNLNGVCSPAEQINYIDNGRELKIQLNKFTINSFEGQNAACYPTICKGKFVTSNGLNHIFEEPTSLSLLTELTRVIESGVSALKIEGRQRGSAYVRQIVSTFRYAVDNLATLQSQDLVKLNQQLASFMEGQRSTIGAYNGQWN